MAPSPRLAVLTGEYRLEHVAGTRAVPADDAWYALVRAPDGLTIIRDAAPDTPADERWAAFWDRDGGHGLDVPGLLLSVIAPLAGAGIPVFVTSTFHADIVMVPLARWDDAAAALAAAGHEVAV
jgi:hypothetical protein